MRPAALPGAVLVVDDEDSVRNLVVQWLSRSGLRCIEARSGDEGIARAVELAEELDAIVSDVMMPGIDGFGLLERLKSMDATSRIPVVLLTAYAHEDDVIVRSTEAGAADLMSKPFSGPVMLAKVKAIVARSRADKALRNQLAFAEKHATVDALTGLFNRRHFDSQLRSEAANARRHKRPLALLLLDLDHFKRVNDTFGHQQGDAVLAHVAKTISSVLRSEDTAFRYGGEEFAILLRDCDGAPAVGVGNRLRSHLRASPIALGPQQEMRALTFSAGVAVVSARNEFDASEVVARADKALYRAKNGGRDRVEFE
jgi:diguanylate cyclase (GGDEF)-like protein